MVKRTALVLLAAALMLLAIAPATALAADTDTDTVYVGGVALSGSTDSPAYATTDDSGNVSTASATAANYNIKWDGSTLTLRNATIKESVSTDTSTFIAGAAIGVLNQNGDANLTITLEGTNTIAEVGNGICVLAHNESTGNASLTIMGNGSLTASVSVNSGILVQSNGGNATLTIQNADVTAENSSSSGDGVTVRAGSSSSASLSVNGGSLTATGSGTHGAGIRFLFGSSDSSSRTPSLTVSGNAIVRANGGISDNSNTDIQIGVGDNSSGGIVFDNGTGTVYGSVTLQEDLTIGEDESLDIPSGASLTIINGATLTVDGGELKGNVPQNGVVYKVTGVTLSQTTLSLDVGDTADLTATVEPSNATDQNVTWSSNDKSVATVDTNGVVTAVAQGSTTIKATVDGKSAECSVAVNAAETVPVTSVSLDKTSLELTEGETAQLNATVVPANATNKDVEWSSDNESVATVDATGKVSAVAPGAATISVTTVDGSKTATCLVTVTGVYIPPRPTGPDWGDVADNIADAEPGSTVTVDMDGKTVLPGEVLDELAGRDVTLALDMGGGVSWEIYGGDVPADAEYDDVDLGVALGGDDIPADVVNLVTGESGSVQVSLEHDGPFGFELTLVAPLGGDAAGLVANLYRYDDEAGSLGYEASAQVDNEGVARLPFDHASSWLVALDSRSHALPFSDAAEGEWYSEAVRWAWLSGLMAGYGDGSGAFGTEGALSRAQLATVLWRQAGEPEAASEASFADCDPGAFYAEAVAWADEAGIIEGYGDGTNFGPEDPVTREQLATILWRAAGEPEGKGDLSGYPDGDDASSYAVPALEWAVGEGVLSGLGGGTLAPGGVLSRAQLAAVLMRMA